MGWKNRFYSRGQHQQVCLSVCLSIEGCHFKVPPNQTHTLKSHTQRQNPGSTPTPNPMHPMHHTHAPRPCHAPTMHRCHAQPSLPVNQNTNLTPLTCRHSDYMILLLYFGCLFGGQFVGVWCCGVISWSYYPSHFYSNPFY